MIFQESVYIREPQRRIPGKESFLGGEKMMGAMMGGWSRELGMVETIYEEESDEDQLSNCSSPLTPTTSSSTISCLKTRVETWSKASGIEADILVHVNGRCFQLHKDPLTSKSRYFNRQLMESSDRRVHLPSSIAVETFALVACFCYSSEVVVTPFNVVPLRVAAELLEMYDDNDANSSLRQITETYFRQAVSVNGEYAAMILRSCLDLLPEAEESASLASRCLEALVLTDGISNRLIDSVNSMSVEEFQKVAESMKGRLNSNHDLLYKLVDVYLREHNHNLTEGEKNRICCSVDCNKLSQPLLVDAVQNPEMPLRFVIRAMLVEQLNTRRSIKVTSTDRSCKPQNNCTTLGAILRRDAALRYTAQLKAAMDATSARIIGLEHELISMKKHLRKSEIKRELANSSRSASCRFSWERNNGGMNERAATSPPLERPCGTTPRTGRSLSEKLVSGLKNVFRSPKTDSVTGNSVEREGGI